MNCLEVGKNRDVRGTWLENAFQLDMRDGNSPPKDPVPIPLFSDMHPYHCVPHCGVYGLSEYHLSLPAALVALSVGHLLESSHGLPIQLLEAIKLHHSHDNSLEVYFLIHSCPSFASAVDPLARNVNLLFHLWALQGLDPSMQQQDVHMGLLVGGFSPVGVTETPPICEEAEELNGLPLGRMGTRILYMHEGQLSPNNAQVMLSPDHTLHSLFTLAHDEEQKRAVVSLHLIPSTQDVEKCLVEKAANLKELLHNIQQTDQTESKLHFNTCRKFIFSACLV